MRISFTLLVLTAILARSALPETVAIDPTVAAATAIAPGAIIDADLKAHKFAVHPTAGYFTGSTNVDSQGSIVTIHGFGVTGEAQYSISDHVGVNFSALWYKGSGNYMPGATAVSFGASPGPSNINGWLVGAELVLDPLTGEDFRLPFFIGINYEQISSGTPSSSTITSAVLNSTGYMVGFSPRFNFGFLRIAPFFISTVPANKGKVTCSPNATSGSCSAQNTQIFPVFGLSLLIKPWNLGFYVNLSSLVLGTGVSFYSFGPQFTF